MHNFSLHQLSSKEEEELSFVLDEHIPSVCNWNKLFTEFEMFYQNILKDIFHLNNDVITRLKTKLRHTCDKYSRIKISYKYRNVIDNLRRNKQLVILKQDKEREVVLLDKTRYVEKYLSIITTNKLKKLDQNPTVSHEAKIQCTLRKMKSRFTLQEYNKVYRTGSNAGKLYGTAKIHKLLELGTVDQLPLRPIVSNIGTASYYLAKHLGKILAPLSKSEYTLRNTKFLPISLNLKKIPSNHQLISFDVVALFTNVPTDATIDIIIRRIYEFKEIDTKWNEIAHTAMLQKCSFYVYDETFIQVDGVAMGSSLEPILAGNFMLKLERNLIPILKDHSSCWRWYLDDTICFIKTGLVEHVLSTLNNFHSSIKFTIKQKVVTCYPS